VIWRDLFSESQESVSLICDRQLRWVLPCCRVMVGFYVCFAVCLCWIAHPHPAHLADETGGSPHEWISQAGALPGSRRSCHPPLGACAPLGARAAPDSARVPLFNLICCTSVSRLVARKLSSTTYAVNMGGQLCVPATLLSSSSTLVVPSHSGMCHAVCADRKPLHPAGLSPMLIPPVVSAGSLGLHPRETRHSLAPPLPVTSIFRCRHAWLRASPRATACTLPAAARCILGLRRRQGRAQLVYATRIQILPKVEEEPLSRLDVSAADLQPHARG
jgi:hypothetical protein